MRFHLRSVNLVFCRSVILRRNYHPTMSTTSAGFPRILSIQSHIVHGFVGNKAAAFPLQTMGFDIDCVNTVTLSNHPAYAQRCRGAGLETPLLRELIQGLEDNSLMKYDVLISGYTRQKEHLQQIVDTVTHIRRNHNPRLIYICDPVLGDNGSYYVPEELRDLYVSQVLPQATVITPNVFETQVLCGSTQPVTSVAQAVSACRHLHDLGPEVVILTGLSFQEKTKGKESISSDDTSATQIEEIMTAIVSYRPKFSDNNRSPDYEEMYRVDFPKQPGALSGCGDLFTSLVTPAIYHTLSCLVTHVAMSQDTVFHRHDWVGLCVSRCVAQAAETMTHTVRDTLRHKEVELRILAARDRFIFHSEKIQHIVQAYATDTLLRDEHYHYGTHSGSRVSQMRHSDTQENDKESDIHATVSVVRHNISSSLTHSVPPLHPLGVIFDMDGTLTLPGAIDFKAMRQALYETHPPLRHSATHDIVTALNNLLVSSEVVSEVMSEIVSEVVPHSGDVSVHKTQTATEESQLSVIDLHNRLYAIVESHELAATQRQQLRPALHDTLLLLRRHCHIPLALSTRNCLKATDVFLRDYDLPQDIFDVVQVRNTVSVEKEVADVSRHTDYSATHTISTDTHSVQLQQTWVNKPHPAVAEEILRQWHIIPQAAQGSENEVEEIMLRKKVVFVGDSMDDMSCGRGAGCTTILMLTEENAHLLQKKECLEQIDHVVKDLQELVMLLVGKQLPTHGQVVEQDT